jgi:hypothetical protein
MRRWREKISQGGSEDYRHRALGHGSIRREQCSLRGWGGGMAGSAGEHWCWAVSGWCAGFVRQQSGSGCSSPRGGSQEEARWDVQVLLLFSSQLAPAPGGVGARSPGLVMFAGAGFVSPWTVDIGVWAQEKTDRGGSDKEEACLFSRRRHR